MGPAPRVGWVGRLADPGGGGKSTRWPQNVDTGASGLRRRPCKTQIERQIITGMTAVAFDTLRFVRTLRDKAKLPPEQAEGLADAMAEALQGDLVTRSDLRAELAETRSEIIRGVAGLIGFQTLAILGAVLAFVRVLH